MTDIPLEPDCTDVPPWEQEGAIRRDCEPHRAELQKLSSACMVLSGFAVASFGLTGLLAFPLGLLVWLLSQADLREMAEGRMDPAGRDLTRCARGEARFAFFFGLMVSLLLLAVVAWQCVPWAYSPALPRPGASGP